MKSKPNNNNTTTNNYNTTTLNKNNNIINIIFTIYTSPHTHNIIYIII